MKSITQTARVNTAIQVIEHMNNGMTVVDACNEAGLARSSFYDIVNNELKSVFHRVKCPVE